MTQLFCHAFFHRSSSLLHRHFFLFHHLVDEIISTSTVRHHNIRNWSLSHMLNIIPLSSLRINSIIPHLNFLYLFYHLFVQTVDFVLLLFTVVPFIVFGVFFEQTINVYTSFLLYTRISGGRFAYVIKFLQMSIVASCPSDRFTRTLQLSLLI